MPPPDTFKVPVIVFGAKVKVFEPLSVMAFAMERPLKEVAEEVASVRPPVRVEPYVCFKDVTPLLIVEVETHAGRPFDTARMYPAAARDFLLLPLTLSSMEAGERHSTLFHQPLTTSSRPTPQESRRGSPPPP